MGAASPIDRNRPYPVRAVPDTDPDSRARYDARVPNLACRACGRQIYTTSPIEALFAEERRCPRCGAFLDTERRATERRSVIRRQNPPQDPGPPAADGERRERDRRTSRRRAAQ